MMKRNTLFAFFCVYVLAAAAQPGGNFNWIQPLSANIKPIGVPSYRCVAFREGAKQYLLFQDGTRKLLPYDSVSHLQHKLWRCWSNNLQGVFEEDGDELLPPVYDQVSAATADEKNWAFSVSRYGMTAVVNRQNKLLLDYQKSARVFVALIGDSILAYQKHPVYSGVNADVFYISRNGYAVADALAREQSPPDFQRISSNQYLLTVYKNGKARRDTFVAAEKFVGDVAQVKKDSLWGYIRRDGAWLIKPGFQAAFPFDTSGFAIVKKKGLYGVIRRDGTFALTPQFDFLKTFSPGVFEFKQKGWLGLVDAGGKVLIPAGEFAGFQQAGAGFFAAKSGDSLLIYSRETGLLPLGKVLNCTPERYQGAIAVTTQPDKTSRQKRIGILAPDGSWLIPPVLEGALRESENHFAVETVVNPCCTMGGITLSTNRKDEYIIFDRQGNLTLPGPVKRAFPLGRDKRFMAFVSIANKHGLLGPQNRQLSPEYDEINPVGKGWFFIKKGAAWGIVQWVE